MGGPSVQITRDQVKTGVQKVNTPSANTFILSIVAGIFLSLGALAYLFMASSAQEPALGKFLGAAIFPVGLIMIIMGGGYLFTGNNLMFIGLFEQKYSVPTMFKNWIVVWFGNLVGAFIMVLLVYASAMFATHGSTPTLTPPGEFVVAMVEKKVGLDFISLVARGILCNIAVAGAVMLSGTTSNINAKVVLIWFPVAAFVIGGYEHVVANMFYLPLGLIIGAPVTLSEIVIGNYLPVTIGNILGGAILSGIYYLNRAQVRRTIKERSESVRRRAEINKDRPVFVQVPKKTDLRKKYDGVNSDEFIRF